MNPLELDLVLTFIQQHPDAAARELEMQGLDKAAELIQVLPLNQAYRLLSYMLPSYAARLCVQLPSDLAVGLLTEFKANQVATILRSIPKRKRDHLLKGLSDKTSTLCHLLLSYTEDSVGAWMNADVLMLPQFCSVAEALQRFENSESSIFSDAIPVVDNSSHLIGIVHLRDLLRAKEESHISSLIQSAPIALASRASLAVTANHDGWKQHDILPVLNRSKQLIGVLRHADLRLSLEQFGEITRAQPQDDLIGSVGKVYMSSMIALLGLIGRPTAPRNIKETPNE